MIGHGSDKKDQHFPQLGGRRSQIEINYKWLAVIMHFLEIFQEYTYGSILQRRSKNAYIHNQEFLISNTKAHAEDWPQNLKSATRLDWFWKFSDQRGVSLYKFQQCFPELLWVKRTAVKSFSLEEVVRKIK